MYSRRGRLDQLADLVSPDAFIEICNGIVVCRHTLNLLPDTHAPISAPKGRGKYAPGVTPPLGAATRHGRPSTHPSSPIGAGAVNVFPSPTPEPLCTPSRGVPPLAPKPLCTPSRVFPPLTPEPLCTPSKFLRPLTPEPLCTPSKFCPFLRPSHFVRHLVTGWFHVGHKGGVRPAATRQHSRR